MTVGIVFVSHSSKIAEGLVDLARQMAPDVALVGAGGTDDGRIGTSFDRVSAALSQAETGDGVVVLCDLGSAVLTAETALEFLDEKQRNMVRIVDAPLIEGGVAAAVAAQTGGDLASVASAATDAASGFSVADPLAADQIASDKTEGAPVPTEAVFSRTVTLINRDGLHARPAAEFVKLATTFDAHVTVNGKDAKSLLGIMSLGLVQGRDVELAAEGPEASDAVERLAALIESGFGEH